MKITDNRPKNSPVSTDLTAIPVGTIFSGVIQFPKAGPVDGIWYKSARSWVDKFDEDTFLIRDCVVVRLDNVELGELSGNFMNLAHTNRVVNDYKPLKVELVIKG